MRRPKRFEAGWGTFAAATAAAAVGLLIAATAAWGMGGFLQKRGGAGCISEQQSHCGKARALVKVEEVTVSPDGRNVYAVSSARDTIAILRRDRRSGALTQRRGKAACVAGRRVKGGCSRARALDSPVSVAVSPDGKSVYVAGASSGAVAVFDRNPATGALTQKPGGAGAVPVTAPKAVTVSPDGRNVYVAARDTIAVFDRDPATGTLTQKPGAAGCIAEAGGVCQPGRALKSADDVTVSPDGRSVYVASIFSAAVAIFDRDPATGTLTQKPGDAGCVSKQGSDGCRTGKALAFAGEVTVSPDGKSVYVASSPGNGIAIFDRDPATGALTQKPGAAGCLGLYLEREGCVTEGAPDQPVGVTVSPDGRSVYAGSPMAGSISILKRNPATGALTPRRGKAGCISQSGKAQIFEEEEDERGVCRKGRMLKSPNDVAVSPDGRSIYVASPHLDAVAILGRTGGGRHP